MQKQNKIKKSALAPTILIAGGAGFIGSHLAEILLQKEARVIVLDNFTTGKDIYISHLLQNSRFALYDVDINQGMPEEIESVDYIFHLAGLEEYLYSKDEVTLDSLLTNAVGTKQLLDLANKSDAKFLLASTIDVYGGMMSQLSLDTYYGKTEVEEKKYSFAEAKRFAEALVWEYYKKNNTDVRIVRLPEVYGPRMSLSSTGVLGRFLKDLIENKNLTIHGDGTQKEFYVYINDVVSGMVKALFFEKTAGRIFSLVPREPASVLETAFLVRSLADRQVDVKFVGEASPGTKKIFEPDLYNLGLLNWEPRITFKDGVISTLAWFGYKVNENSFKNAQLILEKQKEKMTSEKLAEQERLTTLKETQKVLAEQQPKEEQPSQEESAQAPKVEEAQKEYDQRRVKKETKGVPKLKRRFKLRFGLRMPKSKRKVDFSFSHISLASKLSMFLIVLFSFLAVFIFMPAFQVYSSAKQAKYELEQVPEYISQFDSERAAISASQAKEHLIRTNKYLSSLEWLFKLSGKKEMYQSSTKFLNSVTYFSNVAYDLSMSATPYRMVWESLKPNSEATFEPALLDQTKLHISNAKNSLELALADYNEMDHDQVPGFARESIDMYGEVLDVTRDGMDLAWAITSDLPGLIGFDGPKKYLILFQNNNEIRPTGGFIGSYAFLYLNEGKIEELSIDDIYNPDGQIDVRNIRVTPPKPIGDLLIEDRMYIRNSNWDPDFPRSTSAINDLFFRLNGENIDGVIAVDLHMVSMLLEVTGPIYLATYNEDISSENLYERTQHHASYNYEEGSDQKRQFLTVLGSKLLETLFSLEQGKTSHFFTTINDAFQQRHLQIHFFSSPFNASLLERKWDGSLVRTDGDYLHVVNANLGGTKANYYVKNSMDYTITSKTRDGLLRAELTLTYDHTGTDNSWPGGPYTNYVRVLTQKGSKLTGAKITYDQTIEEDIFEDIIISQVEPYASFETSFTLNPSNQIEMVLYYDLPVEMSITKENSNYSFVWQKQAGTHDDTYAYDFSIPFGMEFVQGSENTQFEDGHIVASGKLNEDLEAIVELQ